MQNNAHTPSIYISYAWNAKSEGIAEAIESEFEKRRVRVIRDKNDLGYKGRIRDFMDQLGQGRYVILVISNKYLRSENCMYELLQIFKNQDFYERIFPVVLDEVKISRSKDRIELIKYWEDEVAGLDKKLRELKELSNIQGVTEDINLYREIRDNIGNLTNILKDINTLNTDQHIRSDFTQLFGLIKNKIEEDGKFAAVGDSKIKRFRWLALAAGFIGLLLLLYYNLPIKPEAEPLNTQADSIPSTEVKADTQIAGSGAEGLSPGGPQSSKGNGNAAEQGTRYNVTLLVPSNMVNAAVYVDNHPAEVVERNLVYIRLRLRKKNSSHHIEIVRGSNRCETDRLITGDLEELIMCN